MEIKQAAHSVAVVGASLLAETDAKISGTAGSVCFPHRSIRKQRAAVGAEVLASLAVSYC